MFKKVITGSLVALIGLAFIPSTYAHEHGMKKDSMKEMGPDIVDIAASNGSFNTLVAAVKAAGLVETLKGDGPFTVFAPTDEAFAKLPAGTVESLLKPENRDKLIAVLTYHVIPGERMASDVVGLKGAKTVQGQFVEFTLANGGVMIDNANVVATDVDASNGVIHVIDSVIIPGSTGSGDADMGTDM